VWRSKIKKEGRKKGGSLSAEKERAEGLVQLERRLLIPVPEGDGRPWETQH